MYCLNAPILGYDSNGLKTVVIVRGDDEGVPLSRAGYECWKPRKMPFSKDTFIELDKPTKEQLIEALIEADEFWFWGHGTPTELRLGNGVTLTLDDLRRIHQERKRRRKAKMKKVHCAACNTACNADVINAWLDISEEYTAHEGLTAEPGDWTRLKPPKINSPRTFREPVKQSDLKGPPSTGKDKKGKPKKGK